MRRNHYKAPSYVQHDSMVYFLIRGEHIKIGVSVNVPKRIRTMQQQMSDVLGVLPGGRDVEAAWHRRFAHLQDADAYGGREWFVAADELLEAIAEAAVTNRGQWDQLIPEPARLAYTPALYKRSYRCAL